MKNKNKKILLGLGTLGAVVAPLTAVIACGSEDTLLSKTEATKNAVRSDGYESKIEDGMKISLAVPSEDKIKGTYHDNKHGHTKGQSYDNLEKINTVDSEATNTAFNIHNVKYEMSTLNSAVLNSIDAGTIQGAFLPSRIMGKGLLESKIRVAFLSARPAIKFSGGQDDNPKVKGSELSKEITSMNKLLAGGGNTYKNKDQAYSSKLAGFYRSEIYISDPKAKEAWDKKDLNAFINLGIITHSSTSESGYLIPEQMIRDHFNKPDFQITDHNNKIVVGKIGDLDTKGKIYFSFAGEVLQKGVVGAKAFLANHSNFQALVLSDAIINDGFAVGSKTTDSTIQKFLDGMKTVIKAQGSVISSTYYHKNYNKPSKEELEAIVQSAS